MESVYIVAIGIGVKWVDQKGDLQPRKLLL
jgi:hypothetical protein